MQESMTESDTPQYVSRPGSAASTSGTAPIGQCFASTKKPKSNKRLSEDSEDSDSKAFTTFIEKNRGDQRDAEDLLMESYAIRMKQLSEKKKSLIRLQLSQIYFDAENPHMQIPISTAGTNPTTSTKTQPADHPYFHRRYFYLVYHSNMIVNAASALLGLSY